MRVFIDRRPVPGPWGGGNKTVTALHNRLQQSGIEISPSLEPNVDLIFCFDPRPNSSGMWYQNYLEHKNRFGSKIIQRVGDCGTHGKPELTQLVRQSIYFSDFVIFPSEWAKNYTEYDQKNYCVIPNGPNSIFYKSRRDRELKEATRVVTHHWSTNEKKGFNFYAGLDEIAEKLNIKFTYIGRIPANFELKNSTYIEPLNMEEVAAKVAESDLYLTASLQEAGANHVLEALAIGLPVVYHRGGGSIVEYCSDYGEGYDTFDGMVESLKRVTENYQQYHECVMTYQRTVEDVIDGYMDVVCQQK